MRLLASLCVALALAGCSTVGVDTTTPAPSAPTTGATGLDNLHDNIANLVLAIELPQNVYVTTQSTLHFDVNAADATAARHVTARLVQADADGVAQSLPPLPTGHIYYFFGIADADKAAIREAQSDALSRAVPPASVALTLAPNFCAPRVLDATQIVTTVRAILPGKRALGPLVDRQTLAQVLARSGASTMIAVCAR